MDFKKLNETLKIAMGEESNTKLTKQKLSNYIDKLNSLLSDTNLIYKKSVEYEDRLYYRLEFTVGYNFVNVKELNGILPETLGVYYGDEMSHNSDSEEYLNSLINKLSNPDIISKLQEISNIHANLPQELERIGKYMVDSYSNVFSEFKGVSSWNTSIDLEVCKDLQNFILKNKLKSNGPANKLIPDAVRGKLGYGLPTKDVYFSVKRFDDGTWGLNIYFDRDTGTLKSHFEHIKEFFTPQVIEHILLNADNTIPSSSKPYKVNKYSMYTTAPDYNLKIAQYPGYNVQVEITRTDEWEEGDVDFETVSWYVGGIVKENGRPFEVSLTKGKDCSLMDAIKIIKDSGFPVPDYTSVITFLNTLEKQFKTDTLDAYLQKHESELKQLCS